jgi:hypothetical protein
MEYTIDNPYYPVRRTSGETKVSPEGKGLGDRRFPVFPVFPVLFCTDKIY